MPESAGQRLCAVAHGVVAGAVSRASRRWTYPSPGPDGGVAPSRALRPFEVIGIPLNGRLSCGGTAPQGAGSSLLDDRHGTNRTMRAHLGAGDESACISNPSRKTRWSVTTAQDSKRPWPVPWCACPAATARRWPRPAPTHKAGCAIGDLSSEPPRCSDDEGGNAYFVSARATAGGIEDMSFTWSDWHKGIEPWRFNVPTSTDPVPDTRPHDF